MYVKAVGEWFCRDFDCRTLIIRLFLGLYCSVSVALLCTSYGGTRCVHGGRKRDSQFATGEFVIK